MNFCYASIKVILPTQIFISLEPDTEYQQAFQYFQEKYITLTSSNEVKDCHIEIIYPEQCLGGGTNVTFLAKKGNFIF